MIGNENFSNLSIELLAEHCADETRKFRQRIIIDTRYCFELLCRAYRDADEAALSHSYRIYLPLLSARAKRHVLFSQSCQNAEFFARAAFANSYNAIKGEKFLQKFSKIEAVIGYLHACLNSVILQDIKDNPAEISLEDERLITALMPSYDTSLEQGELWSHISSLLPDREDRLLARLRFILEMKPSEIVQYYPRIWATPRDVSIALQRIRRHLRADIYLHQLAGLNKEFNHNESETQTKLDENADENP
ncbi:MAG: hypothetical protein H0X30_32670 [Anaerolineae bacterium]|nr:hypothetical protein [Anaerolineae bacterium]